MNIAIGNDHAGVAYKQAIITALQAQGHQVLNCGTDTPESVDYPDLGTRLLALSKKAKHKWASSFAAAATVLL